VALVYIIEINLLIEYHVTHYKSYGNLFVTKKIKKKRE